MTDKITDLTSKELLEGLIEAFYNNRDAFISFGWEDMARGVDVCIEHAEYCLEYFND